MAGIRNLKIGKSITNRDSKVFMTYLKDVSRYPLLTVDEEVNTSHLLKSNSVEGKKAREKLINSNLRFVVSVAKQYERKGIELEDLIAEGNIGLIKAVDRFDVTRGFKFTSYAVWWIRQCIMQYILENSSLIRVPLNVRTIIYNYTKWADQVVHKEGRVPTIREYCELEDIDPKLTTAIVKAVEKVDSIDKSITDNSTDTVADKLVGYQDTDSSLKSEDKRSAVNYVLNNLKPRERDIVCAFYGIGERKKTLDEIARRHGLTRERVRQINVRAISSLKRSNIKQILREYL